MKTEICNAIREKNNFAIISHYRPDGDAIGSTLALGLALRSLGKTVQMWNHDGCPQRYAFLAGAEEITPPPPALPANVECFICVDTGDDRRLGNPGKALLAAAPLSLNIDHHGTNLQYAHINMVRSQAAACGSIIYELITELGVPLSKEIAEALYAAISTDTGSFKYGSTRPTEMRIAADLIEAGVDVAEINRKIYDEKSEGELITAREVLANMVIEENGALSHYSLTRTRKAELQLSLEDTKDLVDHIRPWAKVKACAIFEEMENGKVRVSLRSKDERVNVADIALEHGGGGHKMAAGIPMQGKLDECREQVLNSIRKVLRNLS
ncbi:MAG: bifunctional oligoribonuclease/PAP phosphatase NrnA [Akkermansia sp.]|nr:bifunctional oligoribonuclease/PAP phosphatase NrnA [Akkermansia sp.]